ncbi:MAG: sigma-54 dependent transcriptional regulator [Thermodesulfovibrionales bacterium]
MSTVLIVDDEDFVRFCFSESLRGAGFSTFDAPGGREAMAAMAEGRPDAVLIDLKMPHMDGIETMLALKKIDPDVPMIIITGHADISTAVEAIKVGAYDFIVKPPDFERLFVTLKRAIEQAGLVKEIKRLHTAVEVSSEGFFGTSRAIQEIIDRVQQVSPSDFSVIIQGETGTGKTTVARTIHRLSRRVGGPFVMVDIGALPETLVESELFGYEKGAFTGADKKKKGFFEIADGGTLLIDELQNMSPYVQGKLLRAVEEKRIYPLGSIRPVEVNVRLIAASNSDLHQAVREKRFREDLFFRLSEFVITLPPLRERVEDVLFLAQKFLVEACKELHKPGCCLSDNALRVLQEHSWPGNVRELKNVVRRAVLLSGGTVINVEDIGLFIEEKEPGALLPLKELSAMAVRKVERQAIRRVLEITAGNKTKAASILQVDYKTLLTKIKDYSI